MQHLIAISPILGALDSEPKQPSPRAIERGRGGERDRGENHSKDGPGKGKPPKIKGSQRQAEQRASDHHNLSQQTQPINQSHTTKLSLTTVLHDDAVLITPSGVIDAQTVDGFQRHVLEALKTRRKKVVIDLSALGVISSRGLRVLTLVQRAGRAYDTRIVLACPTPAMREVLAISRYDMVFDVVDTVEDAIGH